MAQIQVKNKVYDLFLVAFNWLICTEEENSIGFFCEMIEKSGTVITVYYSYITALILQLQTEQPKI